MPWVVWECGRRGAIGSGPECLMPVGCVTRSSFSAGVSGSPLHIGSGGWIASAVPEPYADLILRSGAGVYHRAALPRGPVGRVSKDEISVTASWFETRKRLLTMRDTP